MQNKISDKNRLLHILEAIQSLENFTSNKTYEEYYEDYKLRLASVKLLEIIGEAATGVSSDTQNNYPEIEWAILKGVRNILIHEYFGIDYGIVWKSIKENIPFLKEKITSALKTL